MSTDSATVGNSELLTLLQQLPEGVIVLDADSKVLFANKPGARLVKLKYKSVVGQEFPYAVEDGPMRDFDVELSVKSVRWGGEEARLVHLKSLKSAGAFHLEWKLEAALERARAAEEALEQAQGAPATEGKSLEEALAAAESEKKAALQEQKRQYDDRLQELESLLEEAEARVDELADDDLDYQSATELQNALKLAREAEDQVRQLEEELAEARDRVRVSEEQAEVAEERAYNLEAELVRLEGEADVAGQAENETQAEEIGRLQSQLEELNASLQSQREQAVDPQELESLRDSLGQAKERIGELESELERAQSELAEARNEALSGGEDATRLAGELGVVRDELSSAQEQIEGFQSEFTALQDELASSQDRVAELEEKLGLRLEEVEQLQEELGIRQDEVGQLQQELGLRQDEVDQLQAQIRSLNEAAGDGSAQVQALNEQLQQKEESIADLQSQLEQAREAAALKEQESQELEEHLRAEMENSEEIAEQLRQQNEALMEQLSEQEGLPQQLEQAETENKRLEKDLQKMETRLAEAEKLAAQGEKAEKLERKLEGALRRAEEADERLQEERRLLNEMKQRLQELGQAPPAQMPPGAGEAADPETERLAFQDTLTGLPNRNILDRYLSFMVKQSARHNRYTALLRIDCDNFKTINDTLGHKVGDDLIRQVGERLSSVIRNCDVLGRMGEDEFVILLSELTDQKEASVMTAAVIRRIYQAMKKPFGVQEQTVSIGVSIGVSLYPLDASNVEQMFEHSHAALRRVKETGRGQAQYYTQDVQKAHDARTILDSELKAGLERNEFGMLYQPIFDLQTGQIVGAEALIRWNHPRMGVIGPDEFLRVAEESGIIVLIGNWGLRACLAATSQWQQQGLGLFVSFNLSQRQLLQADLLPTVQSALNEFRCSPERVLLEISEGLTGPEMPRIRETLAQLQKVGVRLAVDNFGTASSSLPELRRGPFSVIKVDRRFIRGVPEQEDNKGIVMSALTLSHHLNRIAVAVGVESEKEKAWLVQTGCRFAQGNLLSPPLPAEAVVELIKRRQA